VGEIDDIYLYTVDDLQQVIEENQRSRRKAAEQAEELIDSQVGELMGWLGSQDVAGVIRAYRSSAERTRDEVLERALGMLKGDKAPEQALRFLANTLTNKLIHSPTTELRRAGATGDHELVGSARALLGLPNEPAGSLPKDEPG
jgi:glutamyl-tRNA reductase